MLARACHAAAHNIEEAMFEYFPPAGSPEPAKNVSGLIQILDNIFSMWTLRCTNSSP
jgi:hypothetical protein